MYFIIMVGLLLGIIIGVKAPIEFPDSYTSYMAMGILACMDSVFGGIKAYMYKNFYIDIFLSGFFGNAILAISLTFIGDKLGINLQMAAIVVYGSRLFQNFAHIRRFLLDKKQSKDII